MRDDVTPSPSDPLAHYATLGIGPLADMAEIKAAYRYKAKILHPDHNPSDEASQEFIAVVEAYRVLRDPKARAAYDSTARLALPVGLIDPTDASPEPLKCARCGKITAQPRYIVFYRVKSFLLVSHRKAIHGIFCRDCADRTAIRASTVSWILGWWGIDGQLLIESLKRLSRFLTFNRFPRRARRERTTPASVWNVPGPMQTIKALVTNLRGGDMPRADNLWVLLHQARAFLARGDNDIARALAEQAQVFARDDSERSRIADIVQAAGTTGTDGLRRLKSRWGPWNYAAVMQALPLAALSVAMVVSVAALIFRSQTDSASAMITVHPAQAGEVRHVAVEVLKLREGPAATQPVVALLDRFATVQVVDTAADGEWARILTPSGVTGYVPSRFLFGGPGTVPKSRWCTDEKGEPLKTGDILMRRSGGEHRLAVHNATGVDVVVRLKTPNGRTLLAFFVAAGADTTINGIPDGTFRAVFATGQEYSHACAVFLDDMKTFIVPTVQVFQTSRRGELSLTVPPMGEGPGQSHPLPVEDFLDN